MAFILTSDNDGNYSWSIAPEREPHAMDAYIRLTEDAVCLSDGYRDAPLSETSAYICYLAAANEALKRAGGDPFCLREAPRTHYRGCWYNAGINRETTFRDAGLRVAIGCLRVSGVTMFGFQKPNDRRYAKVPTYSHAWLEDAYGRIYDYLHAGLALKVLLAKKTPTFKEGEVRGMTRAELAAWGVEYIEADVDTTEKIVDGLDVWIPRDVMLGFRHRTPELEEAWPFRIPRPHDEAADRNAQAAERVDESWEEAYKRNPLEACRRAARTQFIDLE